MFIFILFSSLATWGSELYIYNIIPNLPLNWSSPQTLAVTTAANSAGYDYAPIGHFIVEVRCQTPNEFGIKRILTGMERKNKVESRQIVLKKKLGLGSLVYSFEGKLQTSVSAYDEIMSAQKDQRLKVMKIPTSEQLCQKMLTFMDHWITHGSYKIYGGGKKTSEGEGAGCADFAMEFFKIATNLGVPHEWQAKVRIPYALIGDGQTHQVEFSDILKTTSWGNDSNGRYFEIADTNMVDRWIEKNLKKVNGTYLFDLHLDRPEDGYEYRPGPMTYYYRTEMSPEKIWREIGI